MTNAELITKIKSEIERRIKENESWKDFHRSKGTTTNFDDVKIVELQSLLSFLSTLESEKPMVQEGLEEEIDRLWGSFADEMEGPHNLFDIYARLARHFAQWGAEHLADARKTSPKDLEEAAVNWICNHKNGEVLYVKDAFIAGAKWQAGHTPLPEDTVLFNNGVAEGRRLERDELEKNRLTACSNQTKEEYDRETDFALGIIKKEHRQPTFSDAINYGMRLQKEQMMKEAVEGVVCYGSKGAYIETDFLGEYDTDVYGMPGDKVRIIVCKNED